MIGHMRRIRWWVIPLVINILLLSCTVGWSFIPKDTGQEYLKIVNYLVANMSLRGEMTLAAWWSGTLMFATGLACYENAGGSSEWTVASWSFLAIVFVGFAVDEMASIHERLLGNWSVIIALVLAGGIGVFAALWTLSRRDGMGLTVFLFALGIGLMASAAPQEYLEHSITWKELPQPKILWNLRLGMEEGSEIFGALLCLIGAVNHRREADKYERLASSIPNPLNMSGLLYVAITSFFLHVAVTVAIFGRVEIGQRGDPFVVYPTLLFMVAFATKLRRGKNRDSVLIRYLERLTFVATSIFTFYFLSVSTDIFPGDVRASVLRIYFLLFVSFYLFSAYGYNLEGKYKYAASSLLYFLAAASFFIDSVQADYILFGLLSLVVLSVELESVEEMSASDELAAPREASPSPAS